MARQGILWNILRDHTTSHTLKPNTSKSLSGPLKRGVRDSGFKPLNEPEIQDSNFKQARIRDSKLIFIWANWQSCVHIRVIIMVQPSGQYSCNSTFKTWSRSKGTARLNLEAHKPSIPMWYQSTYFLMLARQFIQLVLHRGPHPSHTLHTLCNIFSPTDQRSPTNSPAWQSQTFSPTDDRSTNR